ITAAVAIMVSLLVSFTLTPMMSARLLRAEASHSRGEGASNSRRGFYGFIDRAYTWMLGLAIHHRLAVAGLALLVILSSIPLYKAVKQDYIPTDVDESEFDVSVTAREGTSLEAMNQVMRAVETDLRSTPGVSIVLANV